MEVNKVSATIRYSQDTGHGAWKVIEIGAEATVSDREFWKQAQSELYYQLGDQFRQLWHNGTGAALNGAGGAETAIEPLPAPEPTKSHGRTGATPTIWSGSAVKRPGWCGIPTGRARAGATNPNPLKGGEKRDVAGC